MTAAHGPRASCSKRPVALWSGRTFAATGVSIDTRTIQPGDLFVALQGESGDGHGFVTDALARARPVPWCIVTSRLVGRLLLVDDTLAGLHRLGGYARERFTGRLVAVTGSVGKTTTKEMLRTILARVRSNPCRRRLLQQPMGPAADPGAHAAGRSILRCRDRHEPCR